MIKKRIFKFFSISLFLFLFFDMFLIHTISLKEAGAAGLSVEEIITKANLAAYYQGKDGRARVSMTITDRQGRERFRKFTILRMDLVEGGEQKYYVFFMDPPDVRNTVFMVWKNPKRDDDRWLYLPALDLVSRIAAGDKRSSFVGSHFLYEDISGRDPAEDHHQLLEETDRYFILKSTPKKSKAVKFSSYLLWIDRTNFMPMKAEYFDKNNEKYRIIRALKVETIQGHPTIAQSEAQNLQTGGKTNTDFSQIKYDLGLTDDIFTERYLRRPPRQWIK